MENRSQAGALEARLRRVESEKQGSYEKRTEHLDASGKTLFINRLILEDSPYLLQHAHNPVNWYAWGDEAFATAAAEHKPIFLSIGYSTCHWCHVMEVESFDNIEVAKFLNEHFISIKMDREQYPDIDEIYMTGVQIMSGQGGWPMSNFLLADGKPFFGGTYFPAASFMQLLQQVDAAWRGKYQELETSAVQISAAIDRILAEHKQADALDPDIAESMLQALMQREDRSFGGLAGAPKFPQEPLLLLLLDRAARNRELESLAFVERALNGMGEGGIYDQVAGGFHRYSVDAHWLVPHFEKMLYNQSQLGLAYLQAYRLTGNHFFQRICAQTLDYVVRDMQQPEGGFYSATDADSEGEEGTFFTWTVKELQQVLNAEEFSLLDNLYDLSEGGNFEGSNILSLRKNLELAAKESGDNSFYDELDRVLLALYEIREQRIHPLRDDKLIVAWTGAMITTLAQGSFSLAQPHWLIAAQRAAQLVWKQNVSNDNGSIRLKRIYLDGTVSINGQLEDYVNFVEALIALFDVSSDVTCLDQAAQLMQAAIEEFWDPAGGFYLSPAKQQGPQLTRSRNASDGATLSPVATALRCLILLQRRQILLTDGRLAQDCDYSAKIDATIAALIAGINDNPLSHPSLLRTLAEYQRGSIEPIQYAGNGLVKLTVQRLQTTKQKLILHVQMEIQPGWHVTAPQEVEGSFVAIELTTTAEEEHWSLHTCLYPPTEMKLENNDAAAVLIYEGDHILRAELNRTEKAEDQLAISVGVKLRLQLCNDRNCLLPEELLFRV